MRIATYNVENLFMRPSVMNRDTWEEGRPTLDAFAELSALLAKERYGAADRARMTVLMTALGLERNDRGRDVLLRRNRGALVRRPRDGGIEIVADGRADWVGSLELIQETVDAVAIRNTARVIADANADIIAIIEAENRPALAEFNRVLIRAAGGRRYRHVMLIDGNDSRGIDVGIMTREDYPIDGMRSHVDDLMPNGAPVFSRDCPRFRITTPCGTAIEVLVNHFKSKGYGDQGSSNRKRRAQAERVAELYRDLTAAGAQHVVVCGDFNDTPRSAPLRPLLQDTDLRDATDHPAFDTGGLPGTYGFGKSAPKIDYLLLSPALFARVRGGEILRKGMWPGSRNRRWEPYPEVDRPIHAASDHAALWVDIDL